MKLKNGETAVDNKMQPELAADTTVTHHAKRPKCCVCGVCALLFMRAHVNCVANKWLPTTLHLPELIDTLHQSGAPASSSPGTFCSTAAAAVVFCIPGTR